MNPRLFPWLLGLPLMLSVPATAGVVINEIFYHAPDSMDDLQWIELHNPDPQPADISGWRLTRGVEFQFPANSVLPSGGFVVLSKDPKLFAEFYEARVGGQFKKSLGRSGDTVELVDGAGRSVDRVTYGEGDPWPASADGVSASLERITPNAPGARPGNWSGSPLPEDEERPAGTPGQTNASHSSNLPPAITAPVFTPAIPVPGKPIRVQVSVDDDDGVAAVELRYRVAGPGTVGEEKGVPMVAAADGTFSGEIPGLEASTLVRVRVRAVDRKQAERFLPSPHALRPAISLYVVPPSGSAQIPLAFVISTDPREHADMERLRQRSLQPDEGPFGNRERRELQELLGGGLDLPAAWYQLTVNQTPDSASLRKLRAVFKSFQAGRNRLIEESLAASDLAAEIQAVPARIQTFQSSFSNQVMAVLPADRAEGFDTWLRKRTEGADQGGGNMLGRLLNVEGAWFGIGMRSEITTEQLDVLRPILKTAIQNAQEAIQSAMGPQMDFGKLQERLGTVRGTLDDELRRHLTRRQWHALMDWRGAQASPIRPRLVDPPPRPPQGRSAFVVVSRASGTVEVFDFLHVTERSAGYKVRFHKDRPWNGMTSAAILFEYNDRFVLAEPLAFDLYRRAGNAACQTDFVRLNLNGNVVGYHLVVEQVNGAFLRRNRLDASGDLYKILWYGTGVEGQHEKQNHPDRNHADLLKLVTALNATTGEDQWALIQQQFEVDHVINYFAVNLVLSHWDGFFNNYFTFRDRKGDGKWSLFPWDQDKTWGFHDATRDQVFFDMPTTFGMAGDRPPGGGEPQFNPGSWWRPGGHFSQPLLANPEFRKRYLRRVRQILEEVYTEAVYFPVIDAMAERLRPEVPIRAAVIAEDPALALARLDRNVASLKEHLVKRRQFLLEQAEIKSLPR